MRGFLVLASFLGVSVLAFAQDPPTSESSSTPTSQPASRPTAPVQSNTPQPETYKANPPQVAIFCYDCYGALIVEDVRFPKGSASPTKESFAILDEVVKTLQEHPEIAKIEISGHADPNTETLYADKISLKRANAIRSYLISQGIDAKRLVAKGYGARLSLNQSKNKDERAENRRVEFHVLPP